MSDDHLQELQAGLAASPDNLGLRFIVLRLLLEHEDLDQARQTVAELSPDAVSEASRRLLIAEAWHRLGEPERAMEFLSETEEPAGLLRRSRVLADLEQFDEARDDYERAIAADIALEDPDLKKR